MGLFVPFFLFVLALFIHFYYIWTTENTSASASSQQPVRTLAAFAPSRLVATRRTPGFFHRATPVRLR
jgi:hypothetical protein